MGSNLPKSMTGYVKPYLKEGQVSEGEVKSALRFSKNRKGRKRKNKKHRHERESLPIVITGPDFEPSLAAMACCPPWEGCDKCCWHEELGATDAPDWFKAEFSMPQIT